MDDPMCWLCISGFKLRSMVDLYDVMFSPLW